MYRDLGSPIEPYSKPDIVALGWNERATGPVSQPLYADGYCSLCAAPVGGRTDAELVIAKSPKADIAGFHSRINSLLLISEKVLDAFTSEEVEALGLRPVRVSGRAGGRRFFEVAGEPTISQVAVKNGNYLKLASWHCPVCGYSAFSCNHPDLPNTYKYSSYFSRSDLPGDLGRAFLSMDTLRRPRICMGFDRFTGLAKSLVGTPLWPSRVYCIDESEVCRSPSLPPCTESNW